MVNLWRLALYDIGLILAEYFLFLPLVARSDVPMIYLEVMRWILGIEVVLFWGFLILANIKGEKLE